MNAQNPDQNSPENNSIVETFGILVALCLIVAVVLVTDSRKVIGGSQEDVAKIFATSEVDTALQAYKTNTGSYPTTKEGLLALITQPEGVNGWKGPYFTTQDVPKDPWGRPYHYTFPSTHGQPAGKYDCWSLGPDGIDGTADDITNWSGSR